VQVSIVCFCGMTVNTSNIRFFTIAVARTSMPCKSSLCGRGTVLNGVGVRTGTTIGVSYSMCVRLCRFLAYKLGHLIEKISLTINRARCRLINQ